MKQFDNFDEFSEGVEKDNIVELLFREDIYFNLSNYLISNETDGVCIPVNTFVGYYDSLSLIGLNKSNSPYLVLRLSNSMHTRILVRDFKNIVKEYRILE